MSIDANGGELRVSPYAGECAIKSQMTDEVARITQPPDGCKDLYENRDDQWSTLRFDASGEYHRWHGQ